MQRRSGVLLHPTSLPGGAVGSLGPAARTFVDWLAEAGQSLWQLLPLVPPGDGNSPYNGLSAMAGSPLLIDLEALADQGLLSRDETAGAAGGVDNVDFASAVPRKEELLRRAAQRFSETAPAERRAEFENFRERHSSWLPDYALFRALRERAKQAPWTEWEDGLRRRLPGALQRAAAELRVECERFAWEQFVFEEQWQRLHSYAAACGISIIGDIPIFVAMDSADVWAHPELFRLKDDLSPEAVSGVPPDYFSETGQRWGNPLYDWDTLAETGFQWWIQRFRRVFDLVDVARVDHFRGFAACWEIPPEEETAVNGRWRDVPGRELFAAIRAELGPLPLIAEDLGLITPDVDELREALGLPGMRVLQFAFDDAPENPHLPENYPADSVAYTGTHDNATLLGWWSAAPADVRAAAGRLFTGDDPDHWQLIRLVVNSAAVWAVIPLQDVLGLGEPARMNIPGQAEGNWRWRFSPAALRGDLALRLRKMTDAAGRLPPPDG